jgi:hypothetical protein
VRRQHDLQAIGCRQLMTIPQVSWDNIAGIQAEFVPGRLDGGRLVIEIEYGEEFERLLPPGP